MREGWGVSSLHFPLLCATSLHIYSFPTDDPSSGSCSSLQRAPATFLPLVPLGLRGFSGYSLFPWIYSSFLSTLLCIQKARGRLSLKGSLSSGISEGGDEDSEIEVSFLLYSRSSLSSLSLPCWVGCGQWASSKGHIQLQSRLSYSIIFVDPSNRSLQLLIQA